MKKKLEKCISVEENEALEKIYKSYREQGCMSCAIWDTAAQEYGKRGMCKECFNRQFSSLGVNE